MAPGQVIIGYYRFTDIFFEWHKALPDVDDIRPLKAMVDYSALVHPDHPLRKEGQDGIELYIGTFDNGEARLLFSSAQVEYIRYYIHAMGLTKKLIPLPGSEYIITQSSMQSCSPVIHNNASALKKAIKDIDKINRRLKGTSTRGTARRIAFERIRTYWCAQKGVWLAIDFEMWDRDHTMHTEFGYSMLRFEDGKEVREDGHFIVSQYQSYRNTYTPDHKERYCFGTSEVLPKKEFRSRIAALINEAKAHGAVYMVFHGPNEDVKALREIDAPITNISYILTDLVPFEGLYVIDTADMFAALEGEEGGNIRNLEKMCRHLGFTPQFLHNAGNDAYWTLEACKAMASGDPIDAQRSKRWPEYISATRPGVNFKGSDDESDMEDII